MALRRQGIPHQLVGNRGLYDRDEVRDVIALIKTIIDPSDTISLYRVFNISTLEVPYSEISKMLSESRYKKKDLWEPVIPGLMWGAGQGVSYLIYNSFEEKIYEGLVRPRHKEWAQEIAQVIGLELISDNKEILALEKRYKV